MVFTAICSRCQNIILVNAGALLYFQAKIFVSVIEIFFSSELAESDLGEPLHSLIICGECHPIEEDAMSKLAAYFNGQQTEPRNSTSKRGVFHLIGLGLGQPG